MDDLWNALAELAEPSDEDAKRLRCVQLSLAGGATFDVYKAERAPGPITIWRVRGFHGEAGPDDTEERACVILGTKDGRALANFDGPLIPIESCEPTTRALSDLSEVIGAAVRRLIREP